MIGTRIFEFVIMGSCLCRHVKVWDDDRGDVFVFLGEVSVGYLSLSCSTSRARVSGSGLLARTFMLMTMLEKERNLLSKLVSMSTSQAITPVSPTLPFSFFLTS